MSYTKQALSNELFVRSHPLLFETGISDIEIKVQPWENSKGFFATGERSDLPFDIFAASFFLLSRYEEYTPHVSDEFGRFTAEESLAFQQKFLHQPVIDIWAYKLKTLFKLRFPDYNFVSRHYQVQPIIDVPVAFNYKHKGILRTIGGTLLDFRHLRFKDIFQRFKVLLKLDRDPYDTFNWLIFMQKKYKQNIIVLFLLGNYSSYDKNISTNNKAFVSLIKSVADYCLVGLKVSYLALENLSLLKKEKKTIEAITHQDLNTVRHSYSKLNLPTSYRNLIELEIYKDYSMGYVNHLGFRAGTCTPFQFYDLDYEIQTPLQITPYQCLDFSLQKHKSQLDKTQHLNKIIGLPI